MCCLFLFIKKILVAIVVELKKYLYFCELINLKSVITKNLL